MVVLRVGSAPGLPAVLTHRPGTRAGHQPGLQSRSQSTVDTGPHSGLEPQLVAESGSYAGPANGSELEPGPDTAEPEGGDVGPEAGDSETGCGAEPDHATGPGQMSETGPHFPHLDLGWR